ncbi:MAG: tetratricopeptide repeat protein [Candidatus Hodarchaeales archaeon]|jgi:tetratricopeptide (TPR) repeat protein
MTVEEELKQVKELIYKGHYQKALQELGKLESRELADEDRLVCQLQKCSILTIMGNFENALNLANQVFQDSKRLGKPLQMIKALISKGENFIWLGRLTDALSMLEKADHNLKQVDSIQPSTIKEKQLLFNYFNGLIQFRKGDLFNALEKLLKGPVLSEELITTREEIIIRNFWNLSTIYNWLGQFDLGLEYGQKGLVKSEEIGYKQGIGWCLQVIGSNSLLKGELNQASEYFRKSLSIFKKLDNKIDLASSLGLLGGVYQAKGETDEACKYLQRGLAVYEKLGISDDFSAIFNIYLAWTFKVKEKYDAAINAYDKSISTYYSLNAKHWMVHFLHSTVTKTL